MKKPYRADPARGAGGEPDVGAARFAALALQLREDVGAVRDARALARACGLSTAESTALFIEHAHIAPAAWLDRERVLAAGERLLDGREAIAEIAQATGFASDDALRRRFAAVMRMTPEAFRALRRSAAFELRLPAGYRAEEVLAYHGRDPESPSERVEGPRLTKAVTTAAGPAVLEVTFRRGRAVCRVRDGGRLGPGGVREAHVMALRMLGLMGSVRAFEAHAMKDPSLAPLVMRRRGLHLPLTATPFEALAWAILGQQINLAFASSLRREILRLAGERIDEMIAHPTAPRLAAIDPSDLTRRRFSRSKAAYLLGAAEAVASGTLDPDALGRGSAPAAERRLTSLHGIGTWTARYVLMRGAGFADCAPVGDAALAAALERVTRADRRPAAGEVEEWMKRHTPHRSLVTFHLWASLRDARR
jgi:AraC family transcriptional regulator, regulatory protein of adaptative response / DNA-3-methyladenine glycosylase II